MSKTPEIVPKGSGTLDGDLRVQHVMQGRYARVWLGGGMLTRTKQKAHHLV